MKDTKNLKITLKDMGIENINPSRKERTPNERNFGFSIDSENKK